MKCIGPILLLVGAPLLVIVIACIGMACTKVPAGNEAGTPHCEKFFEDDRVVAYYTWVDGYSASRQVRLVEKRP